MAENFGSLIKAKRNELGISMRELERRSGLSQSYISQLENGLQRSPKMETIQKLAAVLPVEIEDLLSARFEKAKE